MVRRGRDDGAEPETVTEDQRQAAEAEDTPQPRDRSDADDVEAEQGKVDEQIRESAPDGDGAEQSAGKLQGSDEQRKADDEQARANRESTTKILESQGMTYKEGVARLTRERGYADDLPLVSHTEAWETGYAGQVPDRTPNEAYQAGGDEAEAARADLRAATRGRLGN